MRVELPEKNPPPNCYLRARLPDGWRVTSAATDGRPVSIDDRGTIDLRGKKGNVTVELTVTKN
jgi:hypothetical protein